MSIESMNKKNIHNKEVYDRVVKDTDAMLEIMFNNKICLASAARQINLTKSTAQKRIQCRINNDA